MTRLPDLERSLIEAAQRLDDAETRTPAVARGRRRRGIGLLSAAGALLVGGGALAAAATGLLDTGSPVPKADNQLAPLTPGEVRLASATAPDPDGGPRWGIGVFELSARTSKGGTIRCVRVGRVQNGVLGVVGRAHLFGDDGRFHRLPAGASSTGGCGGGEPSGQLLMTKGGGIEASSGYTGAVTTAIGGCRTYGPPNRAVSSPQTRRKLRNVPQCAIADRRIVKYGFAGRQATKVRFANDGLNLSTTPGDDGSWIFVIRPQDAGPQTMRITVNYRNGVICPSPGRRLPDSMLGGPCDPPPGF